MQRLHKMAAGLLFLTISTASFATLDPLPLENKSFEQKPLITTEQAQGIYQHLVQEHWVPQTGLFISFLGTGDHKLSQQASTYEQGTVGILALRMGDLERAQGIFHFLKKAWDEAPSASTYRQGTRGLANFYNAEFGSEGIEKTIHVGPNAWAGLFAARLGNLTGDKEATAWAVEVARWIAKDVPHHNGGVAMGPINGQDGVPWPKVYSTENNLSYYAFLAELLKSKELDPEDRAWMSTEKSAVEDWLVNTAFDPLAYSMNRGTNAFGPDRVRALDTFTWLISAVGPERLQARGIDPDRLMLQAEQSFAVNVHGLQGVDPADQPEADLTFALIQDDPTLGHGTPRSQEDQHRMIWYEGMGQYVNALNTMAAYFQKTGQSEKAASYAEKAQQRVEQFDQAALKNYPAGLAYMYATSGKFFHDGWYTPADAPNGPPSSLIAAVWRCFAGLGMDPLAGEDIAGVPSVTVTAPKVASVSHLRPTLFYGTSEDMTTRAWQFLDKGDLEHAIQQAEATIQEWSPWAVKLEEKKERTEGQVVEYLGFPEQQREISSYWALNDVGAAQFILGKAYDLKHQYAQASDAFREIVQHYPLAQIWDPHGWFWSPVESIRNDYVASDPEHYRDVLPEVLAASSLGKQPN